jgi:NAD(P)-dependent dehydrogenase (short-subunit alcohol dehydrogenase family)
MNSVLIIGASSAIGTALAEYYLQQHYTVVWVSRSAPIIHHPKLVVVAAVTLSAQDDWSLQQTFFHNLIEQMQLYQVSVIFNCIGWLHQQQEQNSGDPGMNTQLMPEKSLSQSSAALLRKTLELNLELPVFYLQGLWRYLLKTPQIRYLQLSAKVGSISDNQLGGWYSYRSAKAALNQWIRTASIELHRTNKTAALVTLHPGTTASALSAPFHRNLPAGQLQSPAQTAERLSAVAEQLHAGQTGLLLSWDATVIPF